MVGSETKGYLIEF